MRRREILKGGLVLAATAHTPAVAQPRMSLRDQALYHMRELERLTFQAGAGCALVMVVGRNMTDADGLPIPARTFMLRSDWSEVCDDDQLFGRADA